MPDVIVTPARLPPSQRSSWTLDGAGIGDRCCQPQQQSVERLRRVQESRRARRARVHDAGSRRRRRGVGAVFERTRSAGRGRRRVRYRRTIESRHRLQPNRRGLRSNRRIHQCSGRGLREAVQRTRRRPGTSGRIAGARRARSRQPVSDQERPGSALRRSRSRLAALRADFGWNWRRNSDPLAITTGRDQQNFDEIRRNLAGTASSGTALFRKNVHVFVYVGGVDFAVSDRFSVGVRARRLQYPSVEVGPYVGDTLRGHVPNLRLDGSEPVSAWSTLPARE